MIVKLVQNATPVEAKYIARWLSKNLKIKAMEATIIGAIARAFANTPGTADICMRSKLGPNQFDDLEGKLEALIKEAICEYPNFTDLIESLLELKDESVNWLKEKCHMRVGVPLKPMLAKPTKGVDIILAWFDGIPFTCEYKYDGFWG